MPETLLSSFLVGMTCVSSFCLGLGNAESSARAKHANASNHVRSIVCKLGEAVQCRVLVRVLSPPLLRV